MPSKFGKTNQELLDDIWWRLCTPEGLALVGAAAADKTLNTPIQRAGEAASLGDGKTSLGALVAWNDSHVVSIISSVAASSAASGASVDQIKEAVQQALQENVIKVDVSVEGAK